MISLTVHLATVNFPLLSPQLYKSMNTLPLPLKGIPTDFNPLPLQVQFSSLAGGKGWEGIMQSLCSQRIKLPPPSGNFPILAQSAQHRFISYQKESTGKTTLVGISSSPLNAQEGE